MEFSAKVRDVLDFVAANPQQNVKGVPAMYQEKITVNFNLRIPEPCVYLCIGGTVGSSILESTSFPCNDICIGVRKCTHSRTFNETNTPLIHSWYIVR